MQMLTYLVGPHGLVADLSVNRTFDDSRNQFGNVLFLLFLTRSLLHCKREAKRMNSRAAAPRPMPHVSGVVGRPLTL